MAIRLTPEVSQRLPVCLGLSQSSHFLPIQLLTGILRYRGFSCTRKLNFGPGLQDRSFQTSDPRLGMVCSSWHRLKSCQEPFQQLTRVEMSLQYLEMAWAQLSVLAEMWPDSRRHTGISALERAPLTNHGHHTSACPDVSLFCPQYESRGVCACFRIMPLFVYQTKNN